MSKRKYIEINKESEDGYRWIENIGTGWRFTGYADELARLNHTGWFTRDDWQDELFRGVVYRLPSRKSGHVYFVGYADAYNDNAARGEVRTDIEDDTQAGYAADRIAELCAEKEREYNEAWDIGRQYAQTFEEVENERTERKALFADLRKIKTALSENDTPAVCQTIKAAIRSTRCNIKSALSERKEILAKYWIRRELLDAFADGAGISIEDAKTLF